MAKRSFDLVMALLALACLWPLFVAVAVIIKLDSAGPVFFRQERVGRGFKSFWIYKFRTMVRDAPRKGRAITVGNDPRVTRIGRVLRKTKIDELPQLLNVIKGEMSIIGPRPEIRKYVDVFEDEYREILKIRPGIADAASLKFYDEAALLGDAADPEAMYVGFILPEKLKLGRQYARESSCVADLALICKTLATLVRPKWR